MEHHWSESAMTGLAVADQRSGDTVHAAIQAYQGPRSLFSSPESVYILTVGQG